MVIIGRIEVNVLKESYQYLYLLPEGQLRTITVLLKIIMNKQPCHSAHWLLQLF